MNSKAQAKGHCKYHMVAEVLSVSATGIKQGLSFGGCKATWWAQRTAEMAHGDFPWFGLDVEFCSKSARGQE
jgi:hypothetical protein